MFWFGEAPIVVEAAIDPPADSTGQDTTGQYLQEQDQLKPAILTAYPPPAPAASLSVPVGDDLRAILVRFL